MYFVRVCLLLMLLIGSASLGLGQSCRNARPPYKHTASVATRYDPGARRMQVILEYPDFEAGKGEGFTILASFYHHDPKLRGTPSVNLTFIFVSSQSISQHARDLTVTVNGNPWALSGPVQYSSEKERHSVINAASVTLSYAKLLEITTSRKTEVQLGASSHKLTTDNLEALRELASQLAPYEQWAKQGNAASSAWSVH